MAIEWFVEDNDRVIGPFNVTQMKAQAAANRIKPETRVRKGKKGKWFAAKNVQGLLPTTASVSDASQKQVNAKESRTSKTAKRTGTINSPPAPQVVVANSESPEEEGVYLAPLRNRKRRAIIFAVLCAFIAIGRSAIYKQLFFDVTMGLIIGTYPIVQVKRKTIEQTFYVFFFPVHKTVLRLRDFVAVEADAEPRLSEQFGCLVYVFFWYAILWKFFDFLMPWLGGTYKLYLKEITDERTLIWQGSNTYDYEANLDLFVSKGLPVG